MTQYSPAQEEAFVKLYEEEFHRACNYWSHKSGLPFQQIEDLVQESFLKYYGKLDNIDFGKNPRSYLYVVINNTFNDHFRSPSFRDNPSIEDLTSRLEDGECEEYANHFSVHEEMPSESFLNAESSPEIVRDLKYLMGQLNQVEIAVITMTSHGSTQVEIGEKLGLSESAVKGRLNKARKKLPSDIREKYFSNSSVWSI